MEFGIESIRGVFQKASIMTDRTKFRAVYAQRNGLCHETILDESMDAFVSLLKHTARFSLRFSKLSVSMLFELSDYSLQSMVYAPLSGETEPDGNSMIADMLSSHPKNAIGIKDFGDANGFFEYLSGANDHPSESIRAKFDVFLKECEIFAKSIGSVYEYLTPDSEFDGCATFTFERAFQFDVKGFLRITLASSEISIEPDPENGSISFVFYC